jgi:threonine/homoserine/homoserine lactone efflux protein
MITLLTAGVVLGLSAGFSPGPLMALVLSQTLKHGIKEGLKVAVSPLITDVPVILLSLFVLSQLADYRRVIGVISLLGGLFVLKLAWDSIRVKGPSLADNGVVPQSLIKGILVNLLSPHPYVFWLTVGAPMIITAESPYAAIAFVAGFLGCLVGAKISLAIVAGRSRQLLNDRVYGRIMRVLGVLLFLFGLKLLRDGFSLLRGMGV